MHGGGRGKGYFKESGLKGGVHIVNTPEEVKEVAQNMVGNHLITKQSGADGVYCESVYVVQKLKIKKEMYLAITLDRKAGCPVIMYSPAGGTYYIWNHSICLWIGMNIEEVAKENPELIYKIPIDILKGPNLSDLEECAKNLGIEKHSADVIDKLSRMYKLFVEKDCTMLEINPLVIDGRDRLVCADSKV